MEKIIHSILADIFKDTLLEYGDTFKDGIYSIFRNVKDYYNRDENKKRKPSS